MINYIEIFEEETILSKRSVKYYLRQNDKESCIQEATVIIGPQDLVNKISVDQSVDLRISAKIRGKKRPFS